MNLYWDFRLAKCMASILPIEFHDFIFFRIGDKDPPTFLQSKDLLKEFGPPIPSKVVHPNDFL